MAKKEKISQKIVRDVLAMIEEGRFPPGSKLPTETELAAHFGVSRLPVREALSVLQAMGVVSSQQGGGSYVEDAIPSSLLQHFQIQYADAESIRHLFEMRKILEPEAAALAAARRTPEQLASIREALKRMEDDLNTEGGTAQEADFEFHRSIIAATNNPILIRMMESFSSLYRKSLEITLKQNIGLKRKKQVVYNEHENILLAIEAGEPELAKVQSAIHVRNVEKKLFLFLES